MYELEEISYQKGMEVEVDLGRGLASEWLSGRIVDENPREKSLLVRFTNWFFQRNTVLVEISKEEDALGGAFITIPIRSGRIRPKTVRS